MKIYHGKNKKQAKEITLKELVYNCLKIKGARIVCDRFSDDSASWIDVRIKDKKGVIDTVLSFDVETDNTIELIENWRSYYKIDEENMKRVDEL